MGNELESKIVELIDKISDGVGIAAPRVYEVLMTQVAIDVVSDVIFLMLWVAVLAYAAKIIRKKTSKQDGQDYPEWEDEYGIFIAWAVWAIMAIICFFVGAAILKFLAVAILNPEYAAIRSYYRLTEFSLHACAWFIPA